MSHNSSPLIHTSHTSGQSPVLSRRQFLKTAGFTAIGTFTVGSVGLIYGTQVEPEQIDINPVDVVLPNLAPEFDGFRLVHISDIHMDGEWMTEERFDAIISKILDLAPDAVVITGDYVTRSAQRDGLSLVSPLSRLTSAVTTIAVLGNHDHWTNKTTIREFLAGAGVLEVSNTLVSLERDGKPLHICGVDDIWERQHRLDLVLDALPKDGAAILLAHEPDYADESARADRFDLQLSGHSHGGQVVLPIIGAPMKPKLGVKYPAGLYRVRNMLQYTTRGVGMIKPYIRINCPPEITVFNLRANI